MTINPTLVESVTRFAPYWRLGFFLALDLFLLGVVLTIKDNRRKK